MAIALSQTALPTLVWRADWSPNPCRACRCWISFAMRIPTSGLMTFSEPMLQVLLMAEPDTDHLLGKPLPVTSAARLLSGNLPDCGAERSMVGRYTRP